MPPNFLPNPSPHFNRHRINMQVHLEDCWLLQKNILTFKLQRHLEIFKRRLKEQKTGSTKRVMTSMNRFRVTTRTSKVSRPIFLQECLDSPRKDISRRMKEQKI